MSLFWSLKYVFPKYAFFGLRSKPGPQPDTASYVDLAGKVNYADLCSVSLVFTSQKIKLTYGQSPIPSYLQIHFNTENLKK